MRIRKLAASTGLTVTAAALAAGLGATTALAATTLTVKVTNGGTYKATARATVVRDRAFSVTCSSSSTSKASKATGSIPTATTTGTSPVTIGTVATLKFKNCTGPLGPVTVTASGLPYSVTVDSKTNSAGLTDAMITGVSASVSMKGCSLTVTGAAPGYYTNQTHKLALTPKLPIRPLKSAQLTISNVVGCKGIIMNGDHPTYRAAYTLNRAIKIHSR